MNNNENKLDTRSPYIRSSVYGIDNMRNNLVSANRDKESSDSLLKQKINNISKRVVGEEIKKFAEVASREISQEFDNLEKRLEKNISSEINRRVDFVEQNMYEYASLHADNVKSLSHTIDQKMLILDDKLKDIEEKLKKLSSIQQEDKLILSNSNEESPDVIEVIEIKENNPEIINEPIFSINIDNTENTEARNEYILKNLKMVASMFEKKGVLFKKNIFLTSLKTIDTEKFLNNKEEYTDINENDREKMYDILIDLMDKLNIDPKEDETIEEFLTRSYEREYSNIG